MKFFPKNITNKKESEIGAMSIYVKSETKMFLIEEEDGSKFISKMNEWLSQNQGAYIKSIEYNRTFGPVYSVIIIYEK